MPYKRFGCDGKSGGGGGGCKGEGMVTLGMKGAIYRLNLMTFVTATSLQSVFFGYAKNSSGIWEARELLRKN